MQVRETAGGRLADIAERSQVSVATAVRGVHGYATASLVGVIVPLSPVPQKQIPPSLIAASDPDIAIATLLSFFPLPPTAFRSEEREEDEEEEEEEKID